MIHGNASVEIAVMVCRKMEWRITVAGKHFFIAGKYLVVGDVGGSSDLFGTIENVRNDKVGLKNDRQFKSSSRFELTCPVNTSVVRK